MKFLNEGEFAGSIGETQTRGDERPPRPELYFPPAVPPAHPYANIVQSATAVGTTSRLVIPQSTARRNFLAVRNASPGATDMIYVSFDVDATTLSWLALSQNQIALFDTVVPQDNVYVISSVATGVVAYAFSTLPTYIFHDEAAKVAKMRRDLDLEMAARRAGRPLKRQRG